MSPFTSLLTRQLSPSHDMASQHAPFPPSADIPAFLHPTISTTSTQDDPVDAVPTHGGRKLCVRHKQMANQNINAKLQKSLDSLPTSERSAITQLWSTFSNAPHHKRKLILEGILTMCCFSQLSHLSDSLNEIIRIDPFSLLPREVSLRILGYLDAISLGRAAQVNKHWKALADDDLLWRRMCGQHIDRKCEKCGWGLPLLERRRLKVELKDRSPAVAVGVGHHDHTHSHDHDHDHDHDHGHEATEVVTRVEALGAKSPAPLLSMMLSKRTVCDPAIFSVTQSAGPTKRAIPPDSTPSGPVKRLKASLVDSTASSTTIGSPAFTSAELSTTGAVDDLSREVRLTRPWKTVYCERLVVERNWRKGRCQTKTLKGHKDGVMCLQYHTSLTNPSYPVLITGSYDRTIRVWNLDTGKEVRQLLGHTRAVRALQFDQMLLFTGAMDGTVRMWNWRAGECLRVLEGHTDGVVSLHYNGYLLATGSADSTANVWNLRTGTKFTLRGHEGWVNAVLLWDGKTSPGDVDPTQLPSFTRNRSTLSPGPGGESAKGREIDPGAILFTASDDETIRMWDLETQECIRTFSGHKAQVQSLKLLMVDMSDEEIAEDQHRRNLRRGALSPVHNLHSPPTVVQPLRGDASAAVEPRVYVHLSHDELKKAGHGDQVPEHVERRKKPILASGSLDGTVRLWDVESGEESSTLFGHIEGVWSVDMDALRMASASHDRTIKVWDRESSKCVQTLVGHRGAVTSLQLSDDMIVSGSDDGDVMVWSFAPTTSGPPPADGTPTPSATIVTI